MRDEHIFNSYIDLGIFLKTLKEVDKQDLILNPEYGGLMQYFEAYAMSSGGCKCTLERRVETAKEYYKQIAKQLSQYERPSSQAAPIVSRMKEILMCKNLSFKVASEDEQPFLTF